MSLTLGTVGHPMHFHPWLWKGEARFQWLEMGPIPGPGPPTPICSPFGVWAHKKRDPLITGCVNCTTSPWIMTWFLFGLKSFWYLIFKTLIFELWTLNNRCNLLSKLLNISFKSLPKGKSNYLHIVQLYRRTLRIY